VSDLAAFLIDRIDEEISYARTLAPDYDGYVKGLTSDAATRAALGPHLATYSPARIIADCEAKRRLIVRWRELHPDVLRLLALPYADHPDYNADWRP
jgi:hypothetical protein